MGNFKQNFKEYRQLLKNVFLTSDNIEDRNMTTKKQIEKIRSCGEELSEGDIRILECQLRDIDNIESQYLINFGSLTTKKVDKEPMRKIKVNEQEAIHKVNQNEQKIKEQNEITKD